MEKGGQRENGHKPDQYKPMLSHQWIPPPQSMKDHTAMKLMAVMAERDAAIQQRDAAVNEKKAALSERDIAIIHRDAAYAERNAAWMERDAAIAALEYARDNGMACPSVHVANSRVSGGKYIHSDAACHVRETQMANVYPMSVSDAVLNVKPGRVRAPRKERKVVTALKPTPRTRKPRRQGAGEDLNKQLPKHEWKDQGLGLNQVAFDDSTMPIPVCSCTGEFQQCYKWGNGGWQSACCTTTMSLYPLPVLPNKKHTRMGGRKMSGSAFGKLLNKLAAEGYDLSMPLDLKDHWAKHGTNRYITIK